MIFYTENLDSLVAQYNITCQQAEGNKIQGEEKIRRGIKLLEQSEIDYQHANEIRKKISELTKKGVRE